MLGEGRVSRALRFNVCVCACVRAFSSRWYCWRCVCGGLTFRAWKAFPIFLDDAVLIWCYKYHDYGKTAQGVF